MIEGLSYRIIEWKQSVIQTSINQHSLIGGLAQLARAPALHAGGQRFESVILHHTHRFLKRDRISCKLRVIVLGNVL